jgi:lycopene elongase/hydratase (dihydrobisanhydrobacterioruberin-forming)
MGRPPAPLRATVRGLLKLARYREYAPFVFLTTLVGVKLADAPLDWRLPLVLAANFLTVCYAFMVNDIADAQLDALHPTKRYRNPVASGELCRRWAQTAAGSVALLTVGLGVLLGGCALLLVLAALGLGWAYSCQLPRLKALPIADLVTHTVMLAGIQFLVGYFVYTRGSWSVWPVLAAFMLFSAYGELYNELHDRDTDHAGGLCTTAVLLGPNVTRILMYLFLSGSLALVALATWRRLVPLGVVAVPIVVVLVVMTVRRPTRDARGQVSLDLSGSLQVPALLAVNVAVGGWVLVEYAENWLPPLVRVLRP